MPQEYAPIVIGSIGLLTTITALYTLAARERKVPYVINSIFGTFYVVLVTLILVLIAAGDSDRARKELLLEFSSVFLLVAVVLAILKIAKLHNHLVHYRTDHLWRNLLGRWRQASYEAYKHSPIGISTGLIDSFKSSWLPKEQLLQQLKRHPEGGPTEPSLSVVLKASRFNDADRFTLDLATHFLANDCCVQYATCARHPADLLLQLKRRWASGSPDWKEIVKRIVVVDGYTPHFGFTDSIHSIMRDWAQKEGIECIQSQPSFPGIHSATAQAFNSIKARSSAPRKPALLIYEGASALAELESEEQCRIFYRHILPSERMWGGMFTLIVETTQTASVLALLESYSDAVVTAEQPRPSSIAGHAGANGN